MKAHRILAASLLASSFGAQAAASLVLDPPDSHIEPGDSVVIEVLGKGFGDAIVGGGFSLGFDPGVLSLVSAVVDTVTWEFISSPGAIDNAAGLLSDVYFNSFKAQLPKGDFSVATLTFSAKAAGQSVLQLMDSPSFPFANDKAQVVGVDYLGATVQVGAVPEPASALLTLAGLLWLASRRFGASRRRNPR